MSKQPKLSICIPTYNQAQFLPLSVGSALEQEFDSFEVVVSDNHSTDGTDEYLKTITDPRLRIVRPDRHMYKAEHFDFCVSCSSGDYVTVLCSDDALFPTYAKKISRALDDHPLAAFGYSAASIFDQNRQIRYAERHVTGSFYRKGGDEIRRFLKNAGCVFPTMMMRRELYESSGGFCAGGAFGNMESVIDWDLQLRLLRLGDVVYQDEVLAEFRVWETGERKRRLLQYIEETARLYDTRVAEIVSVNPELKENVEKARRARALSLALGLSKLSSPSDFEEGAKLVLKVDKSILVRSVLRLYSFGLASMFAKVLVWEDDLRRMTKDIVLFVKPSNEKAAEPGVREVLPKTGEMAERASVADGGVQRVTKGVLANLLGQAINGGGQVLLIPIFLAYWGRQLYGEWLTLSAAVTYLAMLDFGMQLYLVNRLNQCYVRKDYREYVRSLHSALLLSLAITGVVLLLAVPVFLLIPVEQWFQFRQTDHSTVVIIELLLCGQVMGALPCGLVSGCYRSIREYPREQMVFNVRTAATLVFTAVIIALKGGPILVAAGQFSVLVGATAWAWKDLKNRHPEIRLGLDQADLKLGISFLGPGSLFVLIQMATVLTVQGSVVMVGGLFGAASVAVFVPLRTLANAIRQLSVGLQAALWPEFTALETANQYETLRNLHVNFCKLAVTVSVSSALFLHFSGAEIIGLWTHHNNIFEPKLFDAFLGFLTCQSPWITGGLLLAASNNHRRLSVLAAMSSVSGLFLGYYAAHRYGPAGVVYGLWIADVLLNGFLVSWAACRLIGASFRRFTDEVLSRGAVMAALLYVVLSRMSLALPSGPVLLRVSLMGVTSLIVAAALSYLIYFSNEEKLQIRTVVATLARRSLFAPRGVTARVTL